MSALFLREAADDAWAAPPRAPRPPPTLLPLLPPPLSVCALR
jgi:hypothetical protein